MNVDLVLKNIARHISLDEEETAYFTSLLHYREISQKDFLLKEGQLCRSISYVQSGALRAFHSDTKGKEATIMFAISDWWITDMYCFVTEQPAMQNIVAIEDSGVWQLKKDDLERLYIKVPKFERFFRIIMQNSYIREQLRVLQNLSLPAEERYVLFVNKYPQLMPHITQKQVASWLGVTPEFLSTLLKNKRKKHPY
ncbi:MAG TPA: Crp/Fnr family transcriptional regulator [Chitinophagaceae bacterium]|jgi:CRP-like cAMP-binding protein